MDTLLDARTHPYMDTYHTYMHANIHTCMHVWQNGSLAIVLPFSTTMAKALVSSELDIPPRSGAHKSAPCVHDAEGFMFLTRLHGGRKGDVGALCSGALPSPASCSSNVNEHQTCMGAVKLGPVATGKFIPVVHAQVGRAVPMTARLDGLFTASMHLPVDCHIEYKVASGPYPYPHDRARVDASIRIGAPALAHACTFKDPAMRETRCGRTYSAQHWCVS